MIGLDDTERARPIQGAHQFSWRKREGPVSSSQLVMLPMCRSQKSTRWSRCSISLRPSLSTSIPSEPLRLSMLKRVPTAASSPTASRTFSSVSFKNRARFSKLPPYRSVRLL